MQIKGKNYAEILKAVKQTVDPTDIGVNVKGIRRTKNGELLLMVPNGGNMAENLKKEITEKVPAASTLLLRRKKVLHIRGMDEVTTVEEIQEAISKSIDVKAEDFEVRALRPAFGYQKK